MSEVVDVGEQRARPAGGSLPDLRPGQRPGAEVARRMTILGVAAAVFSCLFMLSFGYAQHSPRPHDVRIDVVGPGPVEARISAALEQAVPGGFAVRRVENESVARERLRHMDSDGAFIPAPDGAVHILSAGASGVPLQQAVNKALATVAHRQGRSPQFADVVPLPASDRAGLSGFALELGLLVPAVIGAIGFFLLGRRARVTLRALGAAVYAVVARAFAALILDAALGALSGSPWPLFGDAVLVAATFAFSVAALHCLFGLRGTAIAAGALFVVGNAVNGTAVPTRMLPDVYRQIAPWLPNNAAVQLVRSSVYFGGHGQGSGLLTLVIWLAIAVVIIATTDLMHLRRRRATPHDDWPGHAVRSLDTERAE